MALSTTAVTAMRFVLPDLIFNEIQFIFNIKSLNLSSDQRSELKNWISFLFHCAKLVERNEIVSLSIPRWRPVMFLASGGEHFLARRCTWKMVACVLANKKLTFFIVV